MTLIVKIMGLTTFIWLSPLWKWGDTSFKKLKVYFPRFKKKNLSNIYGTTRTQRSSQIFQNAREFFLYCLMVLYILMINYDYIHPVTVWHPFSFPVIFPPSPPAKLIEKMICPLQQLWTVTSSSGRGESSVAVFYSWQKIGGPCLVWGSVAVCVHDCNGEDISAGKAVLWSIHEASVKPCWGDGRFISVSTVLTSQAWSPEFDPLCRIKWPWYSGVETGRSPPKSIFMSYMLHISQVLESFINYKARVPLSRTWVQI